MVSEMLADSSIFVNHTINVELAAKLILIVFVIFSMHSFKNHGPCYSTKMLAAMKIIAVIAMLYSFSRYSMFEKLYGSVMLPRCHPKNWCSHVK
jgi:uncharacterized membrane protein